MAKVLLTGATGFLGSYLARLLVQSHHDVTAIHRSSSKFDQVQSVYSDINWIECELTDIGTLEELVEQADYIIHSAALISWQARDRKRLYEINVTATHDLVNLALLHPVRKFIHISSIAALGKSTNDEVITEEVEWTESSLNTNYGITKHMAEQEIWRGQAEGLNTLIFNPSLILGAGDWAKGTPALYTKLDRWNPFFPSGSTGMVDVRDVAQLVLKGMESDYSGLRIIASGHDVSYRTLISAISTALGKRPPFIPIKNSLINLLPILDAIKCFFTRKDRTISKTNLRASSSNSKYCNAKSVDFFSQQYIPLEQTISDTLAAYSDSKASVQTVLNFRVEKE